MRHSKRTTLTTDDVDGALNLKNVEVDMQTRLCLFGSIIYFDCTVVAFGSRSKLSQRMQSGKRSIGDLVI